MKFEKLRHMTSPDFILNILISIFQNISMGKKQKELGIIF